VKRLFGTDGIRAVAGEIPLDPATVRIFGAALADVLSAAAGRPPRVVMGRDTRESGPWLAGAVSTGLASRGAEAVDAGVITTPGLAHIARTGPFEAGVMISASHNPFEDNGLKVFGHDGTKLPDEIEKKIESRILDNGIGDPGPTDRAAAEDGSLLRGYVEFLESAIVPRGRFSGSRLLLDCANGSAAAIAPEVFRHHGAEVFVRGAEPDGRNINLGCGSLHLGGLADEVRVRRLDIGIAFDGDADRALAVDRTGRVVDGDVILYLLARGMKRKGTLTGEAVVATVMSNFWLENRLHDEGMRLLRAPVGDKYVLERMITENAALGGEQSGHVIVRGRASTGDGILTGMLLLEALLEEDAPLERILDGIVPSPQLLLNVRVREKPDLFRHPVIGPVVREIEGRLTGTGRILLRYSGTEPLARVMVEGNDEESVRGHAERLAALIRKEIGSP
jgi:phosphoglucosamine mutase